MENNLVAKKARRGFAAMSPERQRQIASQGGKVAHQLGSAHQWNSEEAKEAGRKGGKASVKSRLNRNENDGSDYFL